MIMVFILVSLVALFIMSMVMNRYTSMSTSEISYSDFLQMVEDGKVESVEFDSYQIINHCHVSSQMKSLGGAQPSFVQTIQSFADV